MNFKTVRTRVGRFLISFPAVEGCISFRAAQMQPAHAACEDRSECGHLLALALASWAGGPGTAVTMEVVGTESAVGLAQGPAGDESGTQLPVLTPAASVLRGHQTGAARLPGDRRKDPSPSATKVQQKRTPEGPAKWDGFQRVLGRLENL